MSTAKPTDGWENVGDRFYRKVQLYAAVFDHDIELENYHISGAPFSGALALYRRDDKIYAYRGSESTRRSIDLYSCAGKLIRRIEWDQAPIVGLGWSEDETLIAVSRDGTVRCYTGLSDDFTPFNLGHESDEHGVVDCRFWSSGFVALLGNNQVISVARYDEPRPKLLATPPSDEVVSWTVIPPAYTLSRSVEVLLAIGQTINVVDATDSEDRMLQNGPFGHICVSPNGRFIALYTEDGKVWVISSDFQEKLSEYDSHVKTPPKDMQWCGNDAVVLAWDDEVHLVGPHGAASKPYYYDAWVHLVPDVDGIRLFTNDVCEFLQRVPDPSEDTFKLGSESPATLLLDCVEQLEKKSPKADDNIQIIKKNLVEAVDTCISAAGHEYNIHWQKQLMKAASFGKTVLDLFDSDGFVRMTEELRVLNAVRFHEVGLPLSYDQFVWLGSERLIQRLVNRQNYALALRISEFLQLPAESVYVHWAIQKVRVSTEDEDAICKGVVKKVGKQRGISFEDIARAAHEEGRNHLAIELLNHEPRAGKQVPLLLDMEEDTIALDKATESGDTDLILIVLVHLKKKLPQATFFRTINTRPVATALVESTAIDHDSELLKDLYYQDDRRLDGSNLLFREALSQPDLDSKLSKLRLASKIFKDSKEDAFQTRSLSEYQRLLQLQDVLDADPTLAATLTAAPDSTDPSPATDAAKTSNTTTTNTGKQFTGLSLNQTIFTLIRLGQPKRAQKAATDFSVPDKTLWHIRLRALVASRNFRELEDIAAKNRKSPIGWEVFFDEALKAGSPRTAAVFVGKLAERGEKSARERGEMYELCGFFGRAAEEAYKAKDKGRLEELRGKASGRELVEVERFATLLGKGR